MKKYIPFIVLIIVSVVFFYKSIFFLKVPFPGDILIAEYFPFKYESYLGYNPGSYPNKAQYFDVIRQMYPWKIFALAEIKAGRFPLWNPYNFSGMPFFANNQSSVLNPFNLLFFVASPPIAWSIFIFLQPLLASIFTYLYLRMLKLSSLSSILGGITYSFSLYMGVFMEYGNFGYSILYLPLILYAIEHVFNHNKSFYGPFISVLVAFAAFSGHLQLFAGVVIFCFLYVIAKCFIFKEGYKSLIIAILYLLLGVGIAMIQFLPTAELIQNAARSSHDLDVFQKNILIQIQQLILYVAPDAYGNPAVGNYLLSDSYPGNALYVGILPLVFAIFSLFQFKKNKYVFTFSIIGLGTLFFIVSNPISHFIYSLNIPFLSASAPSNYIFLVSFSLAVLGAIGLEQWLKRRDKKILLSILILACLLASSFILNKLFKIEVNLKQIGLGVGFMIISSSVITLFTFFKNKKFLYLLPLILVLDLLYYFIKFNPFVPAQTVFPKTELTSFLSSQNNTRVWGYSAGNMQPNFQTHYNLYSPEGYDPLYPKWYGKFIYSSRDGKLLQTFSESTRSDALIQNGYGEKDLRENNYRLKVLDNTGVGLILDRPESATSKYTFEGTRFKKIYDKNDFFVYKNTLSKNRVYLTTDYATYSSDKEFESKFFNGESVLLEKNPNIKILKGKEGTAEITLNTPGRIVVETTSSSNSLLVLLDTYYPGWSAKVDGINEEILKANYAFRAVSVPSGKHTVIFEYKPQSFYWGVIVTIISSIATIFMFIWIRKYLK